MIFNFGLCCCFFFISEKHASCSSSVKTLGSIPFPFLFFKKLYVYESLISQACYHPISAQKYRSLPPSMPNTILYPLIDLFISPSDIRLKYNDHAPSLLDGLLPSSILAVFSLFLYILYTFPRPLPSGCNCL